MGNEVGRQRSYRARQKADALAYLAANRGNVKRAAREANIPRKTLEGWARGRGVGPEVLSMLDESKRELADKLMREAHGALDEAAGKRGGASYRDLLAGAGISIDKSMLLRGEATSNVQHFADVRQIALTALGQLLKAREDAGMPVARDVAIQCIIERRPEWGRFLLPE